MDALTSTCVYNPDVPKNTPFTSLEGKGVWGGKKYGKAKAPLIYLTFRSNTSYI